MSNFFSNLFRYVIIGDTNVGKSCIILQLAQKKFQFDPNATFGNELGSKVIFIKNQQFKLLIWDPKTNFRHNIMPYQRGFVGVILVYDITNRQSFLNISKWLNQIKSCNIDNISIILVGNKADLDCKRIISYQQGYQYAKANDLTFLQYSAKNCQKIDSLFTIIIDNIWKKIEKKDIDPKNKSIRINLGYLETEKIIKQKKSC